MKQKAKNLQAAGFALLMLMLAPLMEKDEKLAVYMRGQLTSINSIFVMGVSMIVGIVFYLVGDTALKLNNLQNVGLFPLGLLLLSFMPVLIGILVVFRP